ncbi:acyl carrier protein, partial [Cellulomonas sp. B6]|uniref:acyl carrier protein n=1 Tax=Cellulomonas sp. B6 TaxID=1295626 RepID=UPI0012370CB3
VAEIGGYAPDDVRGDARLGTDLGLDSLMMTTVAARLTRDHPAWRPTAEDMRTLLTVAEIGGYAPDDVRGDARLGTDLGLDSLMMTTVAARPS